MSKFRPAYILGNGPSLRGFDFARHLRSKTSFGMNLAFRYWHSIGWYPTYYSCLDEVVGLNHAREIGDLIENRNRYGIRGFCLRRKVIEALGIPPRPYVYDYEFLLEKWPFQFRGYWSTTGSKTLAWASWLGFRNLILLGVDGKYQKYVENARHVDEVVLEIKATPIYNPNYFFDAYQQTGDLYHVPMQENPDFPYEDQLMGWHMLRPQLETSGTLVVNANPLSRVDAFPKYVPKQALSMLRHLRKRHRKKVKNIPKYPGGAKSLDGIALAMKLHGPFPGMLLDVGSYHGENCIKASKRGWRVCAVEPDEINARILRERLDSNAAFYIGNEVISCVAGRTYPWFSNRDGRWSGMRDLAGGGVQTGYVKTATIRDVIKRTGLENIDLLVLDISGFEFMALRGVPFQEMPPATIIASFNDSLSLQLGFDTHDIAAFLLSQNYHVFINEWAPAQDPASSWQWLRFISYPARPRPGACGQIIAFKKKPSHKRLTQAVAESFVSGATDSQNFILPLPANKRLPHVIRF